MSEARTTFHMFAGGDAPEGGAKEWQGFWTGSIEEGVDLLPLLSPHTELTWAHAACLGPDDDGSPVIVREWRVVPDEYRFPSWVELGLDGNWKTLFRYADNAGLGRDEVIYAIALERLVREARETGRTGSGSEWRARIQEMCGVVSRELEADGA